MTFLHARLGYLTCDQETLAPIIDRAITACVIGVVAKQGSAEDAVAAVLDWLAYGEQAGRIALDFPRTHELLAACVVEVFRRYLRHNNTAIVKGLRALPVAVPTGSRGRGGSLEQNVTPRHVGRAQFTNAD